MKKQIFYSFVLLLCLTSIFLVSCGGGSTSEGELVNSSSVGPQGGVLSFLNNKVTINVPANALTSTVEFKVTVPSSYPDGALPNTVYDITPNNLSFLTPIDLTIHYNESDIPSGFSESDLWLAKQVGDQWVELANYSKDTTANTLTGKLDSLSVYAIIATAKPTSGIGPQGGEVTFLNNKVSLKVPANALTSAVEFKVTEPASYPDGALPNTVYDITPNNLSFLTPVDLTIHYNETDLPSGFSESDLWLAKQVGDQWVELANYSKDTTANTLTGKLDSLSVYAIIATAKPTSGTDIGSNGGTVTSIDSKVSITIPASALSETKNISINQLSTYPAGVLPNSAYNFGPEGLTFANPADVSIYYDENALPQGVNESDLWLAVLSDGRWFKVPGSTVDTNNNLVTAPINGFSTYGIGYGNDLQNASAEAYVVDSPSAANEFESISAALDYLNTNLSETETGKLVLQTDRQLTISTLNFQRAVVMEVADGYHPQIVGPGASPIIINAAGSIGMSGWAISNAGGLQLNTYGNLDLSNNTLPATSVNLGGGSSSSSKPLASRQLAARQNGVFGDQWSISNNQVAGPFSFLAATGFKGELDLTNNTAPKLNFDGYALAASTMNVSSNVVDDIFFHMTMASSAYLKVANHQNLQDLEMDMNLLDQTKVESLFNTSVNMKLDFSGEGYFQVFANASNAKKAEVGLGTGSNAEYQIQNSNYDSLKTLIHKGEVNWVNKGLVVKDSLELISDEQTIARLAMGAGVDIEGNANFTAKGEFYYSVTDDVRLGGYTSIIASGPLSDIRGGGLRVDTGLTVDVHGVTGTVFTTFGTGDQFNGLFDYIEPNAGQQYLSIDKPAFGVGGAISINHDVGSVPSPKPSLKSIAPLPRALNKQGIYITDVDIAEPIQGAAGISIGNVDDDITIENCTLSGSTIYGINIGVVNGNVNIKDNTINDAGINLTDVHGSINLNNNTINASGALFGLSTLETSPVTVTGGSISAANAFFVAANSEVHASNIEIDGNVQIVEHARIQLVNNTFTSSSQVLDGTGDYGGLLNDPLGESGNAGLSPDHISSLIDWNEPHPCADYPPYRNQFTDPENKTCEMEGIAPP